MPQPVAAVTSASRRKNRADTATPFFLIRALFGPARQPLPCPAAGRLFWAVVAHCLEFEQRGPLRHWSESASVDALEPLSSRNSVTTGRLAETENRRSRGFWVSVFYGTLVAFKRGSAIVVPKADGSGERAMASEATSAPAWSPGGKFIAFTRARSINHGTRVASSIVVAPADGRGQRVIVRHVGKTPLQPPTWRPAVALPAAKRLPC